VSRGLRSSGSAARIGRRIGDIQTGKIVESRGGEKERTPGREDGRTRSSIGTVRDGGVILKPNRIRSGTGIQKETFSLGSSIMSSKKKGRRPSTKANYSMTSITSTRTSPATFVNVRQRGAQKERGKIGLGNSRSESQEKRRGEKRDAVMSERVPPNPLSQGRERGSPPHQKGGGKEVKDQQGHGEESLNWER